MKRVLLRLLLIVSFVMNGVAAPWVAAAVEADAPAVAMQDCHHAEDAASDGADEPACCEGPGCQCGCLLTPMLDWRLAVLPKLAWADAPLTVPATRRAARQAAAPFRPPAA